MNGALSTKDAGTLAALLDRLIPADANGPGASEAELPRFVERLLSGDTGLRERYAGGLAALEEWAQAEHSLPFARLDPDAQDARLTQLEACADEFFELARLHAIHGMFGDPAHGGNAGGAGWRLLGFPGAKGTFTAEDQRLG